jgi:hypothetical protein
MRTRHDAVAPAHLDQALHDLYLSHERGEADYAPRPNGWRGLAPFKELVGLGEARSVNTAPFNSYRITLMGLVVIRRMLEDRVA